MSALTASEENARHAHANLDFCIGERERYAAALQAVLEIHDDRFDRREGYMSGLGEAGRIAQAALAPAPRNLGE